MNDEIKALREEIAKLRERVAVLEAEKHMQTTPEVFPWRETRTWPSWNVPLPITCETNA